MREQLILASASPRRHKILRDIGVVFEVVVPEVEEVLCITDPTRTAEENAYAKNSWCRARHPGRHIIAADTVIDFEGRCIMKPASAAEAVDVLQRFSARTHDVLTAVTFSSPRHPPSTVTVRTSVTFRRLRPADIAAYLDLVDPMDKAGAYDIDQQGQRIAESIVGSRTNVMGLPRDVVTNWLTDEGLL